MPHPTPCPLAYIGLPCSAGGEFPCRLTAFHHKRCFLLSCTTEACCTRIPALSKHLTPESNPQLVRNWGWLVSTPASLSRSVYILPVPRQILSGTEPRLPTAKTLSLTQPAWLLALPCLTFFTPSLLLHGIAKPKSFTQSLRNPNQDTLKGEFLFSPLLLPRICLVKYPLQFFLKYSDPCDRGQYFRLHKLPSSLTLYCFDIVSHHFITRNIPPFQSITCFTSVICLLFRKLEGSGGFCQEANSNICFLGG